MTGSQLARAPLDTDPRIRTIVDQLLEEMSIQDRAAVFDQLCIDTQQLAYAGIRRRHPGASEREVFLRFAALRLGRDLCRDVYGWDADLEGW